MAMTVTDPVRAVAEAMLRHYEPPEPRPRQWTTPGALAVSLDPKTKQTPALECIDRALVDLIDGDTDKLIISMPPQEGKSVRVSQRFTEWLLTQNPDLRVVNISYADEMARRWGAAVKLDVETYNGSNSAIDLGIRLRQDSRAAGRWNVAGHIGSMYCVGIGGSVTGKEIDVLIVDDPIKNLKQAQSEAYRQEIKDFWQAVIIPRLGPGSKCVIIQTRWHEEDLAGWLQKNEPGQWKVINIAAQYGIETKHVDKNGNYLYSSWGHTAEGDPLGREPGEFMTSARGDRDWEKIKQNVGEYVWAALYLGQPAPTAGGLFKRNRMRHWFLIPRDPSYHGRLNGARIALAGREVMLDDCWRFLTVDLASSLKTSADWTVAGLWAISNSGDLILLDGVRVRVEEADHWKVVRPLYEMWEADVVFVESAMIGTTMVIDATKSGVPIQELKADTDKWTRAIPAAVRVDNGMLWFPTIGAYPDIQKWIDELVSFPNASHDDCVDVVSYAARVVAAHWLHQSEQQQLTRSHPRDNSSTIDQAFQASMGVEPNGTDYTSLRW